VRRAFLLVRDAPWYRREAFSKGLKAAGYAVTLGSPDRAASGDLLVIWNRYSTNHEIALRFERGGGTVIVAENGYLNADGDSPKFAVHPQGPRPTDYYALGLGFHNDHMRVRAGGPARFAGLGIRLCPWRETGGHILVCPNRSFGVGARVMHPDWAENVRRRLQRETDRPVRVRAHPGNNRPAKPLSDDLKGAWAVYVWSSSCAGHALAAGIPTYIDAPFHILKPAAASGPANAPVCPDRQPAFDTMAWGQWQLQEIERGEPFAHMLSAAG
jgi:hypothetical protein